MFNDYAKNMSKNIYESKHTGTGPTKDDDEDDNSNEIINELKKLGVSKENLTDFDEPMDLYTNLHTRVKTLEDVRREQDKLELLLDGLSKLSKKKLSKKQLDIIDTLNKYYYNPEDYIAMYLNDLKKPKTKKI